MAETTIEWTRGPNGEPGYTFNPWIGCTKVSPACDNCYAEVFAKRFGGPAWGHGMPRRRTSVANWRKPLAWNKKAAAEGKRLRVFCASLADVFDSEVPDAWRIDLFQLIGRTPGLDWLLLAKRPKIMQEWLNGLARTAYNHGRFLAGLPLIQKGAPLPNVWAGVTVENEAMAKARIPALKETQAAIRFISVEPLLGPLTIDLEGIDWVIAGGESGPGARPMHPDWARSLRDQCQAAGVPFFFKQWGEWKEGTDFAADAKAISLDGRVIDFHPDALRRADNEAPVFNLHGIRRVGKKRAGRLLDGREWNEMPKVRE